MMRMKNRADSFSPQPHVNGSAGGGDKEWELRPGGMLVQKRGETGNRGAPPPSIRVRVKYGSVYHEIHVSSQATFGELKKILSGPTRLNHQDQKLFFKDKERDSSAFLDNAGVKDKSKIVLVEDPLSQERRYLEMKKNAKMERASKSISEISLEVDRLASEVSLLERMVSEGGKVAEKDVVALIELQMNQLLKLDAIVADGDVKLQRKMQVRRVQRYVERLDVVKMKNSSPASKTTGHSILQSQVSPVTEQQQARHFSLGNLLIDSPKQSSASASTPAPVVITSQWETFDPPVATSKMQASPWDLL